MSSLKNTMKRSVQDLWCIAGFYVLHALGVEATGARKTWFSFKYLSKNKKMYV